MKTHELKTDPRVFHAVWEGRKTFEIRKDDRGFEIAHLLRLRETRHTGDEMAWGGKPLEYTGREVEALVTYILRGPIYGLRRDWVIMSIEVVRKTGEVTG